jgi:hypothetical protein
MPDERPSLTDLAEAVRAVAKSQAEADQGFERWRSDDAEAHSKLLGEIGGVRADVADIRKLLGEPPNDATGEHGSGMAGQLARLVRAEKAERSNTAGSAKKWAAIGVAIAGLLAGLWQGFEVFGGGSAPANAGQKAAP